MASNAPAKFAYCAWLSGYVPCWPCAGIAAIEQFVAAAEGVQPLPEGIICTGISAVANGESNSIDLMLLVKNEPLYPP